MDTTLENLIGNTPLVALPCKEACLLGKLERQNLSGSVKDRAALGMLRTAQAAGVLQPGGTVIEATSGNTGIALAALCAAMGYQCIIVMPENMSRERRQLIRAYGAQVLLTPEKEAMAGAVSLAKYLARSTPGSYYADQFANPSNPAAHYSGTGPEIWKQTSGKVDIFVACAGTGGTVSGAGRYFKEQGNVRVAAVEPAPGQEIPGIGPGFTPEVLDCAVIDEWIAVTREESARCACELAARQGLLVGISSGAAVLAARSLARRQENRGKTIVALLPDSAERYLSLTLH